MRQNKWNRYIGRKVRVNTHKEKIKKKAVHNEKALKGKRKMVFLLMKLAVFCCFVMDFIDEHDVHFSHNISCSIVDS